MPILGITALEEAGARGIADVLSGGGFDVRILFWPDRCIWDVLVCVQGTPEQVEAAEGRVQEIAEITGGLWDGTQPDEFWDEATPAA